MNSELEKLKRQPTYYREEALKKMALVLDELGQKAYHRLISTKESYRQNIPRRYQVLNKIKIASKFDTGEALGGEFFDLAINNEESMTFFISRTATYRLSSVILEMYQKYKEATLKNLTHFKSFFKDIGREIEELNLPENKDLVHLTLFTYDTKERSLEGYAVGGHKIIFSTGDVLESNQCDFAELNFSDFYFKKEIKDVEKFVILSSGLIDNFLESSSEIDVINLIKKSLNLDTFDFLEEIFFTLRKSNQSSLAYDSSLVALEVL